MEDLSKANVTIPYYDFQKITKRIENYEKDYESHNELIAKLRDNKELVFLLKFEKENLKIISKEEASLITKKQIDELQEELERVKNKYNELILKTKKSWWK
jgi:hypothetical protein